MLKAQALVRDFKLTTARDFDTVFKQAKKFRHLGISVLVTKTDFAHSRIGIIISKKQMSRAVDRNKVKRLIREFFRTRRKELIKSLDIVFLAYSAILELSNDEIRACLDLLWKKLILFCEKV